MKKAIFAAVLVSGGVLTSSIAFAGPTEDIMARLDALEKENAAIRRENAALSENKSLREKNAALKSSSARTQPFAPPVAQPVIQASVQPRAEPTSAPETSRSNTEKPVRLSERMGSVFDSYAADLPLAYKAARETPGQLRIWGEGGAILTGGDPVNQAFALTDFTSLFSGFVGGVGGIVGNGTIPVTFGLTPKIGWEGATGFDYRFAGSPWHVSGQFRYGEGGKTSGTASSAGSIDPLLLAVLAGAGGGVMAGVVTGAGGSETISTNYKETHWLADMALGRDIAGNGASAVQVKGGLRIAELVATQSTSDRSNQFFNFPPTALFGGAGPIISSIGLNRSVMTDQRNAFLGIGPRVGIEGAVPFAGKWSLDYLGDAAILFGTQKSLTTQTTTASITPSFLNGLFGGGGTTNTSLNERFGTVFNGDIQVGISYWVAENVKVSGSYRLDAFINVQNQDATAVTNLTPDRYTHGPRVAVTGQF
jgi:Legionella pneumophila major outer membrane protein precursor